jgi:hypothetical protein
MFKVGDIIVADLDNPDFPIYSYTRTGGDFIGEVVAILEGYIDVKVIKVRSDDIWGTRIGEEWSVQQRFFKLKDAKVKPKRKSNKILPGTYLNRSTYKTSPYT